MIHTRKFKRKDVVNSKLIRAQGKGETLEQMYARLTDKPTYLINGGYFTLSDGWTLSALKADGVYVREVSNRKYGYVLGGKGGNITFRRLGDKTFREVTADLDWAIEAPQVVPTIAGAPYASQSEPRTVLAYNEKSDEYIVCVTDGRPYGITLTTVKNHLQSNGATHGNELDGGGSSKVLYKGKPINKQHENRLIANAIAIWIYEENAPVPSPVEGDPELIIDPGHGGKDPGGGSSIYWDDEGYYEKDMVLKISLYQRDRFKELGVPVALTRDKDIYLSSTERTDIIKASGAKYCISNHINATSISSARGAETIHSIFASPTNATKVLDAIVAKGMHRRRVFSKAQSDGRDWYFMHRLTSNVQTTIVEYGFATNDIDNQLIKDNWKIYAEAVVEAYCGILGYKYTAPKQLVDPAPEPKPVEQILYRLIVDGERIGSYATEEYLFTNLSAAIKNQASEIHLEKVVK